MHHDGPKIMALARSVNGFAPSDVELVQIPYKDQSDRANLGELHAAPCCMIHALIGVAAKSGLAPKVMHMRDHGLTSTAQTIAVNDAALAARPDAMRAFLRASFEGCKRALAEKQADAKTVVERFMPAVSPCKDVAYQVETLRLLAPYVTGGAPVGRSSAINAAASAATAQVMQDFGVVDALPYLGGAVAVDMLC